MGFALLLYVTAARKTRHNELMAVAVSDVPSHHDTLSPTTLEGVALDGLRTGQLTVAQARRLMGIRSRYEMDGFLKARGLLLDLTIDDVRRDSEAAGTRIESA